MLALGDSQREEARMKLCVEKVLSEYNWMVEVRRGEGGSTTVRQAKDLWKSLDMRCGSRSSLDP